MWERMVYFSLRGIVLETSQNTFNAARPPPTRTLVPRTHTHTHQRPHTPSSTPSNSQSGTLCFPLDVSLALLHTHTHILLANKQDCTLAHKHTRDTCFSCTDHTHTHTHVYMEKHLSHSSASGEFTPRVLCKNDPPRCQDEDEKTA